MRLNLDVTVYQFISIFKSYIPHNLTRQIRLISRLKKSCFYRISFIKLSRYKLMPKCADLNSKSANSNLLFALKNGDCDREFVHL